MGKAKSDPFKLAQRMDLAVGVALAIGTVYLLATAQYGWAALAAASTGVSLASAKYVPARWVLRRLLVARTK